MTPEIAQQTAEQGLDLTLLERSRLAASNWYTKLGRVAATGVLILGTFTATEAFEIEPAHADTITTTYSDLGYPWATAPCEFGASGGGSCTNPDPNKPNDLYDWYMDEDGDGQFGSSTNRKGCDDAKASGECFDQWGYEYRNCTSYVAWKEDQLGITVPKGWANGGQWYDKAQASEQSSTPRAGDAAVEPVSKAHPFGHVAYVQSVNTIDPANPGNDNITVSEYNHDTQGDGDTRTGRALDMGFTEYVDFGANVGDTGGGGGGGSGPTFRPAVVQRPSGETDVVAVGPGNSLAFYYNPAGSSSWGGGVIPSSQAYSTPTMVQRPSGETDIVVEGPNNSLLFYFNMQGSNNWGKLVVPGALAYSTPAVVQRASGETDIAVQGANNILAFYYNAAGSQNFGGGPIPGTQAYGEPAIAQRPSGETDIAVQGAGNDMNVYFNAQGSNTWGTSPVAAPGWALSAPSIIQRSTNETDIAVQGPGNSLDLYLNTPGSNAWGRIPVEGGGTTFNAPNPPVMLQRSSGEADVVVQGPGNQADLYYNAQGSPNWGESTAAVGGYSFRAPAMVQRSATGESDLVILGPNNRLDFYFNAKGTPYWANMPIAGNNSAS